MSIPRPFNLRHWCGAALLTSLGASVAATLPEASSAPSLADCDGQFQQVLSATPNAMVAVGARAVWLDSRHLRWPQADATARFRLHHAAQGGITALPGQVVAGADAAADLMVRPKPPPGAITQRFKWVGDGLALQWTAPRAQRAEWHRGQLVLVQEDAADRVPDYGATVSAGATRFKVWAPSARQVSLCLHNGPESPAVTVQPLRRDATTGNWATQRPGDLSGQHHTYLVDVHVRGMGLMRNRVTDPYSTSLTADSRRSWVGRLDAPALQPPGWDRTPHPARVTAATAMVIYELHVRDFSIGDLTVSAPHRGKYAAFIETQSNGMRHLRALAQAGLTDVHLLPAFDLATVPETGCTSPNPVLLASVGSAGPASPTQQALVMAGAARDCFNWGYDPFHFNAPEGSFSSDANDGARRILELRQMVQAPHRAGLRVGMDVVYNHTSASGQHAQSVLDRVVPGYYHRLNALGQVEKSTCCDNTATENLMMARLMIDSAVLWAREYRIDSFRFDLMGHQPLAAMQRLQTAVNQATGRRIDLIGEGWNFGEVKDGARFVQASQLSLNGSGIGTFSDRARDRLPAWAAQLNCCAPRTWSAWAWPARCATTR